MADELPSTLQHVPARALNLTPESNAVRAMADIERDAILGALSQAKGDKLLAAKWLGIGKTTMYRKLKEYAYAAQA
jgi:two-component system response regulator HydG